MKAETPSQAVIELQQLGKQFGQEAPVQVLQDINLSVQRGDWVSITGPSGAGKSTLLNILGCLDRPSSGRYLIDGINAAELSDRKRSRLRAERIGFVFQAFHLLPYRTVLENVMLAGVYRNIAPGLRRQQAMDALQRVGLEHRMDYMPGKLSGGEKQRVAIARALMGSPSLLLCDEPTGNLDSKNSRAIIDLFAALNREGYTLVIITHDQQVAERAARQIRVVDGQAKERQPPVKAVVPSGPEPQTPASSQRASRMRLGDLINEALAGLFSRPMRLFLSVIGIVIGIAALISTLGLTRTAGNRIVSQFDQLAATEIFIRARPSRISGQLDPLALPWNAPQRLLALNGVVAAGSVSEVPLDTQLVSASSVHDPMSANAFKMSVYAISEQLPRAARAELQSGRFPGRIHSERADRVAVLGREAAERLNIFEVHQQPAIYIGDRLYLVIGIVNDLLREPQLLSAIMIPEGTARADFGLQGPGTVVVETQLGATALIARQAALALRPDDPFRLKLEVPREPQRVRDNVEADVNVMFLILGGLSLIVSAIGIANITLVSVMERTGEIGLRRAIGATRQNISLQFLMESSLMGLLGGLLGASLGILIVVGVAAYQSWTPVLDPLAPLLSPLMGGSIGLLAGLYPSLRASFLEPITALRH